MIYKFGDVVSVKFSEYLFIIRSATSYETKKLKKKKYVYYMNPYNGPYGEWFNVREKNITNLHGNLYKVTYTVNIYDGRAS